MTLEPNEAETASRKGWLDRIGEVRLRTRAWRERYHLKPVLSAFIYLIIPLTAIHLIMFQYPLLAKARFYRMMTWIVPLGVGLMIVTLAQERFKKGTRARLALDGVYVGLVMSWLYGFLGGKTVIDSSYGGWDFSVDVTPIVVIILVGTSMNFIHDVLEYLVHMKELSKDTGGASLDTAQKGVVGAEVIEGDMVTITCNDG